MVEITETPSPAVEQCSGDKVFDVNRATENATIVQSTENPYYDGVYDIEIDGNNINEAIEDSVVIQNTENPYYGELDDMYLEDDNVDEDIENSVTIQRTENPYYI